MRQTRSGSVTNINEKMLLPLSKAFQAANTSEKIFKKFNPEMLVLIDNGYTPCGEIFDVFINNNLNVISWHIAHKNNTLLLKRYHKKNYSDHPFSLSNKSWQKVKKMEWNIDKWAELKKEIYDCYNSGEWYAEVGTQFNTKMRNKRQLKTYLNLDPLKKTAIIFPHIFWDATFFWGTDLFSNYEEWFVETVKGAIKNENLNWIVKVHPANKIKDQRDGYEGLHSEVKVVKNKFGSCLLI